MEILIISATKKEIDPLLNNLIVNKTSSNFFKCKYNNFFVDVLITGVGIPSTVYYLAKSVNKNYDLVINAGICGSFSNNLEIGQVVNVVSEKFSDIGIENNNNFLTIFEAGLIDCNEKPFINGVLVNDFKHPQINELEKTDAITVNIVHGNDKNISKVKQKFNPDIETMEGAAVFYVCLLEKVSFIEIRAVSNYVEMRNKDNWNIPLAVNNLNKVLFDFIKDFNKQ
ncbi:MAG: futalosine hydrolase [Bacteroidales bacterium]|nr:futalosine hydrolase [Bacteroidales bacterium]